MSDYISREAASANDCKQKIKTPFAKIKDARWERTYKGTSYEKLAAKYGVAKKTMQNAVTGVTWKCVPYFPEPPEVK